MRRKPPRAKIGDVDDVVVFPVSALTDPDDAEVAVMELFTRAGNIADARKMRLPATARLIDSNGRCFYELSTSPESVGRTEEDAAASKLPQEEKRAGNPFPWFLVLEDAQGECVKVRYEVDEQPPVE